MALTIDASSTVIISSTFFFIISKVRSPSDVNNPSAIVSGFSEGTSIPLTNERYASSAFFGSAPRTLISGFKPFAAIDVPLSIPPPPTGASIYSR